MQTIDKIAKLAGKLSEQGYKGIDCNSDVSLGEYGFLYSSLDNKAVFYNRNIDNPLFTVLNITEREIDNYLEKLDQGFYDFAGLSKDKSTCTNIYHTPSLINSINMYNGYFYPTRFNYTIEEIETKLNLD